MAESSPVRRARHTLTGSTRAQNRPTIRTPKEGPRPTRHRASTVTNIRAGRSQTLHDAGRGTQSIAGQLQPSKPLPEFPAPSRNSQHIIAVELLFAFAIIGMRAITDYHPAKDQSEGGTEKATKGAGPIPMLVAVLIAFFFLASLATMSDRASKFAAAFGGLVDIVLLLNSQDELTTLSSWADTTFSATNASNSKASPIQSSGAGGGNPDRAISQ